MKVPQPFTAIFLLVLLAFLGLLLVLLPGWIIQQYQVVSTFGDVWVYVYFGTIGSGAVLLLSITAVVFARLWKQSRGKRRQRADRRKNPSQLTATQKQQELTNNLAAVSDLQQDDAVTPEVQQELAEMLEKIETKDADQRLEIVAFGTISSGKSSLLNTLAGKEVFQTDLKGGTTVRRGEVDWPGRDQVTLVDTPGLEEIDGAVRIREAAAAAKDADLVLFVVDGPLRDSEFQLLDGLVDMEKRILVCLNKSDWYEKPDLQKLVGQIEEQIDGRVDGDDIVSVRSRPVLRSRVRVTADGREEAEQVEEPADISNLATRMLRVVSRDGSDLLLANLLLQSRGLIKEAQDRVQAALDDRAREIVDKYTWGAGGAAALSPLPVVDLIAGSALSAKMVVELSRVYRQSMDLESALQLLGQLGKNLIAILGVTAATPAVAAGVAALLKTVPGAGTIAGGVLQGIVQAVVTRWIGSVFIHYFKHEMTMGETGLAEVARNEWERITSIVELRKIVAEARGRFSGDKS